MFAASVQVAMAQVALLGHSRESCDMNLHLVMSHPAAVNTLVAAQDLEARGFLRGVGRLILIVIVVLVILGVVVGVGLSRMINRRK
jgi:hypothetical protein